MAATVSLAFNPDFNTLSNVTWSAQGACPASPAGRPAARATLCCHSDFTKGLSKACAKAWWKLKF